MENKFYPLNMQNIPDYCDFFPVRQEIMQYTNLKISNFLKFSNYKALMCRFKTNKQKYVFGQYVNKTGEYIFEITLVKGFQMTNFTLTVNKQKFLFEMNDDAPKRLVTISKKIELKKGFNLFTIQPKTIKNKEKFFLIDKYELKYKNKTKF
jgi:hypothetical protein